MPGSDTFIGTHAQATLRVLIVEDEQRYRDFLVDALRDMACDASSVGNAADALALLKTVAFDALLLDLNLPGIDGLTFLSRFRRSHPDTPVIILTGVGDLVNAQEAIRLGVTDFLTKPCHLGDIERALDRARRKRVNNTNSTRVSNDDSTGARPAEHVQSIAEVQRRAIMDALRASHGNRSAAALALGISRRTLYNKLREYDLNHEIP